jgi:hypothetical protein
MRGNIWRFRNEGVEAFNKTLSKRYNMFNSAGNKGKVKNGLKVQPFEVLGKWMGRYAMWQLGFAQNLFIAKGGCLGTSEICWDADTSSFVENVDMQHDDESDDDVLFNASDDSGDSDSDDIEVLTPDDLLLCNTEYIHVEGRNLRKRPFNLE